MCFVAAYLLLTRDAPFAREVPLRRLVRYAGVFLLLRALAHLEINGQLGQQGYLSACLGPLGRSPSRRLRWTTCWPGWQPPQRWRQHDALPGIFERIARDTAVTAPGVFEHARLGRFALAGPLGAAEGRPPVALWPFIYRHYYSGDRAGVAALRGPVGPIGNVRSMMDPAFVARLRAADAGAGTLDPGWEIVAEGPAGTIVVKGGIRLTAQPDELVPTARAGGRVAVRLPGERPYTSAGYYLLIGDPGPRDARGGTMTRFYFHLAPDGAPPLVAALTGLLNRRAVPFTFKVLNNPAAFTRRDSAVLYLADADAAALRPELLGLHAELASGFRRGTPGFARPLARGLAEAAEPVGAGLVSFGQHRSMLVAEALTAAREGGANNAAGRYAAIVARYAQAGLDVRHPYRPAVATTPVAGGAGEGAANAGLAHGRPTAPRPRAYALLHDGR